MNNNDHIGVHYVEFVPSSWINDKCHEVPSRTIPGEESARHPLQLGIDNKFYAFIRQHWITHVLTFILFLIRSCSKHILKLPLSVRKSLIYFCNNLLSRDASGVQLKNTDLNLPFFTFVLWNTIEKAFIFLLNQTKRVVLVF